MVRTTMLDVFNKNLSKTHCTLLYVCLYVRTYVKHKNRVSRLVSSDLKVPLGPQLYYFLEKVPVEAILLLKASTCRYLGILRSGGP